MKMKVVGSTFSAPWGLYGYSDIDPIHHVPPNYINIIIYFTETQRAAIPELGAPSPSCVARWNLRINYTYHE